MKNLLLTLFMVATTFLSAQTYECVDNMGKKFNIAITEGAYNLVLDSFLIVTNFDTVISNDACIKYVPTNNLHDTMTVYQSFISFTGNTQRTDFIILRLLPEDEEIVMFHRRYIILNSNEP